MFRLALASASLASAVQDFDWEAFKIKYGKTYLNDEDHDARFQLFRAFRERVVELNSLQGDAGPAFGITWAADLHPHEGFQRGLKKPEGFKATAPIYEKKKQLRSVSSIDWAQTHAVTAIKNQGQCGSCWAFSATEAIESQLFLSSGSAVALELSPQQITSCTPSTGTWGSDGCNGGWVEGAFDYLTDGPYLANSFFIPYAQNLTSSESTVACPTDQVEAIDGKYARLQGGFAKVSGYSYATPACDHGACNNQDLDAFAAALEETPVAVCVNAGAFNAYTGGVITDAACGDHGADAQDHCVMATGFNRDAPVPYWIVRNSWSDSWGVDGYVYLEMAKNTCGVADDATIPVVEYDGKDPAKLAAHFERHFSIATAGATTVV